jgi:hypothetical protein
MGKKIKELAIGDEIIGLTEDSVSEKWQPRKRERPVRLDPNYEKSERIFCSVSLWSKSSSSCIEELLCYPLQYMLG